MVMHIFFSTSWHQSRCSPINLVLHGASLVCCCLCTSRLALATRSTTVGSIPGPETVRLLIRALQAQPANSTVLAAVGGLLISASDAPVGMAALVCSESTNAESSDRPLQGRTLADLKAVLRKSERRVAQIMQAIATHG